MKKLEYYVPASHLEATKQAVFGAGGGKIGNYDCCCWITEGRGQFRPLDGSQPFLGQQGEVHQEQEYKVELVFRAERHREIVAALKRSHPYEEPAYQIFSIEL